MALRVSIFQASSGLIGMLKHSGRTPDFFGGMYLHFLSPEDFSGQLMRCWNHIVEVSEGCGLISFAFCHATFGGLEADSCGLKYTKRCSWLESHKKVVN
jgi:hypothetical protein